MFRLCSALLALVALLALAASATERTIIEDYAMRDCTIDQDTSLYALPNLKSAIVAKTPALTAIHILGGQEFGPPISFPHTEEEYARVWFHVRTAERKVDWAPSSVINCGD